MPSSVLTKWRTYRDHGFCDVNSPYVYCPSTCVVRYRRLVATARCYCAQVVRRRRTNGRRMTAVSRVQAGAERRAWRRRCAAVTPATTAPRVMRPASLVHVSTHTHTPRTHTQYPVCQSQMPVLLVGRRCRDICWCTIFHSDPLSRPYYYYYCYYYYARLTASFPDNLGKPVPER